MTRWYAVLLLVFLITAPSAYAGITGMITGTVVDKDNKPIIGATVRVLGTTRGAITKDGGKYTILSIAAGRWEVRVTAISYDTITRTVHLAADQTLTENFKLKTSGDITGKTVEVSADREMVRSTDVGSSRNMSGTDIIQIGRDNLAAVISLNAGIVASGNNFVVRGSRTTETQVLVDGLTVTDQFTGGLGNVGSTISAAMPSPLATEQVQSQTGGFGAEYGNAIGGIVNTVVKTGKTDRYEGAMRWRTDVPLLFGNAQNGLKAGAPGEDVADVTFGGPLGLGSSTFFFSVRNTYQNNRNFALQAMDPIGNNLGLQPNNRTWSRNLTGRLKFQLNNDVSLLVGGTFGVGSFERSSWGWLYARDEGMKVDTLGHPILDGNGQIQTNGIWEGAAKQAVIQEFTSNAFAQINHTLGANTVYDLRISFNDKVTEIGKRKTFGTPNPFTGFEIYYPEDNWSAVDNYYKKDSSNKILDVYENARASVRTEDGRQRVDVSLPNPLTGYVEGTGDNQSTANPFGMFGTFFSHGNEFGVDLRKASFWQLDGNITHNLDVGETKHVIKTGIEFRALRLTRHYNANPWDGTSFYDIYGSDYGQNIYFNVSDEASKAAKIESEKPYTPITGAFFVQDQIQFKGLVFTAGLRADYMDASAKYRSDFDRFYPFGDSVGFKTVNAKLYFSPRLSIVYPISETGRQNISVSYGIYYQAPPWSDFYDSFNAFALRGGQSLGNPNMEMQRTNQYQAAYNHQLTDDLSFTVTGYYKDIYNQSGLAYVRVLPISYLQQVLADYGSARGVEITLAKRLVDNWGLNVNYTLASTSGTANSSATTVSLDPYTGLPAFPVTDFPLSFDRRHRVNMILNFQWGTDEGPAIAGVRFLEHFNVNLSGFWQTGLPYTPVNGQGQAIGQINSARFPSNWSSNLRIVRTIPLGELIGGNTSLDLFVDVSNLLNFNGAVSFYTTSGNPDYDGNALNRTSGSFSTATYYKTEDPLIKASVSAGQYDRTGKRLYNPIVDVNGDGRVTGEETYLGYLNYVKTVVSRQGNYQYPRQVYFGATFRF
ncbi:MAG: TonB-dependent receptor [Ignavibacteria bacterium]|nr:TonB-dependent receptor [Ignavibacteria bacterium]